MIKNETIVTKDGKVKFYSFEIEGIEGKYFTFYKNAENIWSPIQTVNEGLQEVLAGYLMDECTIEELQPIIQEVLDNLILTHTSIIPTLELVETMKEVTVENNFLKVDDKND